MCVEVGKRGPLGTDQSHKASASFSYLRPTGSRTLTFKRQRQGQVP